MPNGAVLLARRHPLRRRAQPRRSPSPPPSSSTRARTSRSETVVAQGQLIPASEESFNHGARVCRIGPDNKLYISLGQPFNVPPQEQDGSLQPSRHQRHRPHGPRRQEPRGLRARHPQLASASTSNPANGELWFTDNQVDGMGDDRPPGEINRDHRGRAEFRLPLVRRRHGADEGVARTRSRRPTRSSRWSRRRTHAADLGMTFYDGRMFPEQYRGAIFNAQHGSWNRTTPVGARVMFTFLNADGSREGVRALRRGLAGRGDQRVSRPAGRRGDLARRLAAGVGRHGGRDLPHLV